MTCDVMRGVCMGADWDPLPCNRDPGTGKRCAFHADAENGSRGAAWLAAKRDARILASERDDLRDALATVRDECKAIALDRAAAISAARENVAAVTAERDAARNEAAQANAALDDIAHALGVCREIGGAAPCERPEIGVMLEAIKRLQSRGPDGFPVAGLTSYAPLLARLRETAERIEHSPTLDRTDARFISGALEIVARLIDEH